MATARGGWKCVENKKKRKEKKRKKGPTEDSTPLSTDEEIPVCEYYHESMHLLKNDDDIIGNIFIEEDMMTKLLWFGILTEQDKSTIGRCAKTFINVLVNKEDPSIWVHVLENLKSCDQARKVHECVVQKIEEKCKQIKDNPSIVLRTRPTGSVTPMHQNNAKLAHLLCTFAPTLVVRHIMQVPKCSDLFKSIREKVKKHPEEYELSEEEIKQIEALDDLETLREQKFPLVVKVLLITIDVVHATDVGVSLQLKTIYDTLTNFQTNIYLQSSKGITSLMLKAQRKALRRFLFKDNDQTHEHIPSHFSNKQCKELFQTLSSTIETSKKTTRQLIERNAIALDTLKGKMPYLLKRVEKLADVLEFQRQLPPCIYGKLSFQTIDSMKKTLDEVLGSQERLLGKVSSIEREIKDISQGVKDLKQIREKCDDRHTNVDLRKALDFHEKSFKILVVNKSAESEDTTSQIGRVIGCCAWNIILELDHNTRQKGGLHDEMAEIFRVNNQYTVYADACNISLSESEKEKVCRGELALWILCNGCSQKGIERKQDDFTRVKTKFTILLDNILCDVQKRQNLFSMFLCLSSECHVPMSKLATCISDACASNKASIDVSNSILFAVNICSSEPAKIPFPELEIETSHNDISPTSFITTFANKYGEVETENKYYFPGTKGECYLTQVQMTRMSTTMQLFHKRVGQDKFKDLSKTQIDGAVREERTRFLRGEPITPEVLFLHENHEHIYVIRDVMKKAKENILKELQSRTDENVTSKYNSQHYTILHEPSAGGSTVLQFLLFELKDYYPCVFLKTKLLEEIVNELINLYKESQLPLLIGIDNKDVAISSISSLKQQLINNYVPCVIVHVCDEASDEGDSEPDRHWSTKVSSELKDGSEDMIRFTRLYEKVCKTIDTNKVFLFGLLAFLKDYARLPTIVDQSLANATDQQKRLLRIIWTLKNYSSTDLDRRLVIRALKENDETIDDDESLLIGNIRNLLQLGYRIKLVHHCLLEPLKTILFADQPWSEVLKCLVYDLEYLVEQNTDNKVQAAHLCSSLFIRRQNPLSEHYSIFIAELQSNLPVEYIEDKLENFVAMLDGTNDGPHLRGTFARFLLYESDNLSRSIQEIRRALDVQETTIADSKFTKDSTLLTMYGWLYRSIMTKRFHEDMGKGKKNLLIQAVQDAKEAVFAFKTSQHLRTHGGSRLAKYSPQSFLGEAITKKNLLNLVFKFYCDSDKERFAKFIQERNIQFLVDCELSALNALDNLETLESLDKLYDNDPNRTRQRSIECKFELLLLRCDGNTALFKNLNKVNKNAPCDFGTIIRSRQEKGKTYLVTPWSNVCCDDLRAIYDLINKRRSADNLLSNNYRDVITSMIFLKSHNFGDFNIDSAIEWARLWKSQYPDRAESHFMHGMLLLAHATLTEAETSLREARKGLEHCKELLGQSPSVKGLRKLRFSIGCQTGLARVVPFNHSIGKGSLETFEGRLLDRRQVRVNKFRGILFAKLGKSESEDIMQSQQQSNIKFNIAVSFNDIVAMNAMTEI